MYDKVPTGIRTKQPSKIFFSGFVLQGQTTLLSSNKHNLVSIRFPFTSLDAFHWDKSI